MWYDRRWVTLVHTRSRFLAENGEEDAFFIQTLYLFCCCSGSLLESIDGHKKGVSSLVVTPDRRGVVSGGADKSIKFWEFDLITDKDYSTRYLGPVMSVVFYLQDSLYKYLPNIAS